MPELRDNRVSERVADAAVHALGPVHEDPGAALWHRGNGGEAIPGVSTPLNADFWRGSAEVALLSSFYRLGAISAAERGAPDGHDSPYAGQVCRFFYGRLATDFDVVCSLYGRLPGVDPNIIEEQMLGRSRGLERPRTSRPRLLLAATKTSSTVAALPGIVRRRARRTNAWWSASIASLAHAGPPAALAMFRDARDRMRDDLGIQVAIGSLQPGFVAQLERTAGRAGSDEDVTERVLSGVAGIAEARMMADLWDVAHGRDTIDRFVTRYGYYAPDEGELSTVSWREDPSALDGVLAAYRAMPADEGPVERLRARADASRIARRQMFDRCPRSRRARLHFLLRLARRYTELREEGKVLMLECLDVARGAARVIGIELASRSVIDRPDDVFFLTLPEVERAVEATDAEGSTLRAMVAERRRAHARYRELLLPLAFTGEELRVAIDAQVDGDGPSPAPTESLQGLGVSAGEATGIARVILDSLECRDFAPGEILVCPTTDPGWAPVLSLAGGVVLDMGSALSHGAIVARELGVPCVANTTDGTRRIPNGARVRIDGGTGLVQVLDPAPTSASESGSDA
jgi:rifampicin phosphotransferase